MRKKRMLELAEFLDTLPKSRFFMGSWVDSPGGVVCEEDALQPRRGTTCCVAGWTALHSGKCIDAPYYVLNKRTHKPLNDYVYDYARAYLGLTEEQARLLFLEPNWPVWVCPIRDRGRQATPKDAAKMIRWMVENEKTKKLTPPRVAPPRRRPAGPKQSSERKTTYEHHPLALAHQ